MADEQNANTQQSNEQSVSIVPQTSTSDPLQPWSGASIDTTQNALQNKGLSFEELASRLTIKKD